MLDIRKLRLLRELAHRGTIAAVADALAYTPSAVSQQLSALEREVGRELLTRTGRRVSLTAAGQLLAAHTEAILGEMERAQAALANSGSGLSGRVNLGSFPTAMSSIVLPTMAEIARAEKELELAVTEIDPALVPGRLRGNQLDIALIHEYDNVPAAWGLGIETEPLREEPVYLASARVSSAAGIDAVRAHRESRWIVGNPGTLCHTMAVRTCQSQGFDPHVAHQVDDFSVVVQLVAAGAGVALIPELALGGDLGSVTLTPLPIARRTLVAYRRGSREQPAIATVAQALHRSVRAQGHIIYQ